MISSLFWPLLAGVLCCLIVRFDAADLSACKLSLDQTPDKTPLCSRFCQDFQDATRGNQSFFIFAGKNHQETIKHLYVEQSVPYGKGTTLKCLFGSTGKNVMFSNDRRSEAIDFTSAYRFAELKVCLI